MKKIILLILVIAISGFVYAGDSKNVGTVVEEPPAGSGVFPPDGDIDWNAYIDTRPSEILTKISVGSFYNAAFGMCAINVGNFSTPWVAGETLVWDFSWQGSPAVSFAMVLTCGGDPQYNMTPVTLPVELSSFTATFMDSYTLIRWSTASETDVLGFNIYRSTEDEYSTSAQINIEHIPGHGSTTEPQDYEFQDIDQLIYETTYYYWLESVNFGGSSNVYGAIEYTPENGQGGFEEDFENNMLMNQPNPFSSVTTISYAIKGMLKSEPVKISIYNTLGQLILEDVAKGGEYQFDASELPTGVYFYKLETESYNNIKKMMIIR